MSLRFMRVLLPLLSFLFITSVVMLPAPAWATGEPDEVIENRLPEGQESDAPSGDETDPGDPGDPDDSTVSGDPDEVIEHHATGSGPMAANAAQLWAWFAAAVSRAWAVLP